MVATLPLLAAFLDEPFEPSPYAPASRLFWNELYVDPRRLPEMEDCPAARRLIESPEFLREVEALRATPRVDYARLAALKRRVLEELTQRFFSRPGAAQADFDRFVAGKPGLENYAAFRAVGDRRGDSWHAWPERLREGTLAPADYDEEDRRYYLWTQWAADQQIRSLATEARRRGPGLYLDLPVGVHGSSYDVWCHRDLFALEASAGAPPDAFFTKGQNWGFPPLQPERLPRARLRPSDPDPAPPPGARGHPAPRPRHAAPSAVLDSARHGRLRRRLRPAIRPRSCTPCSRWRATATASIVVGENLGTVPPEVYEAMEREDLHGMYVVQYEMQPGKALREPPAKSVASLNTHDMPTFQGYLQSRDVEDLQSLGFFTPEQAQAERERRAAIRQGLEEALPPEEQGRGAKTDDALLRELLASTGEEPGPHGDREPGGPLARDRAAERAGNPHRKAELAAESKVFLRGILDARRRDRAVEAGERIAQAARLNALPPRRDGI